MRRNLAADGLPQPREHFLTTYCAECYHIRSEHLDDGVCFPKFDSECDCTRFTRVSLAPVAGLFTAPLGPEGIG